MQAASVLSHVPTAKHRSTPWISTQHPLCPRAASLQRHREELAAQMWQSPQNPAYMHIDWDSTNSCNTGLSRARAGSPWGTLQVDTELKANEAWTALVTRQDLHRLTHGILVPSPWFVCWAHTAASTFSLLSAKHDLLLTVYKALSVPMDSMAFSGWVTQGPFSRTPSKHSPEMHVGVEQTYLYRKHSK